MSLIPTTKFGDCANPECGAKDTEVVKVGKELFCLYCRNEQKRKVQVGKANERSKVRSLHWKQKEMGNDDAASRQNLINDLDYTFSRIVRLRAADQWGNCECYTCGAKKHWSLMQAGHYISRGHMGLRWEFDNVRVQDKKCNEVKGGEIKAFGDKLEAEQAGLPESLLNRSRIAYSYGISELKELLFDFRAKLKPLEAKFALPNNKEITTLQPKINQT